MTLREFTTIKDAFLAGPCADPNAPTPTGQTGECLPVTTSAWQALQQAAAAAYAPCQFTSLVAYEWTAVKSGSTLHKNVIFSSDKVPSVPFDFVDYPDAPALWSKLDEQCKVESGCAAITIPHNSNKSNGLAFEIPGGGDKTIDQMIRYQRLVEI